MSLRPQPLSVAIASRAKDASLWWHEHAAPGLYLLHELGGPTNSDPRAQALLLAIAIQESNLRKRFQVLGSGAAGPARGFWQFERNGGVAGVLRHPRSSLLARKLCNHQIVTPQPQHVWRAIEGNDLLAAGFARLLLWTDPRPLPWTSDPESSWAYYLRNWRPGKPSHSRWLVAWTLATSSLIL